MRRLTYFLPILLCTGITKAQYQVQLYNTRPAFEHRISISGMIAYGDKLYLAAERCKKIFIVQIGTGRITDTLELQHEGDLELEGISAYRGKLYAVSESDARVYEIDTANGNMRPVATDKPFPPIFRGDGLEGIAINETQRKMYVLLERDSSRKYACIFTYGIHTAADGSLELYHEQTSYLDLESRFWRYSDIYFHRSSQQLLCLKSWYNKPQGKYAVEYLQADKNGHLKPDAPRVYANLDTTFLTSAVNQYKLQDFGSNMEGISMDASGQLYLCSDNAMGTADCIAGKPGAPPVEKTLILILKTGAE